MVEPVTTSVALIGALGAIIPAILTLLGILFRNPFLLVIGAIIFFVKFGGNLNLPPFAWIGIIIIILFWLMSLKK